MTFAVTNDFTNGTVANATDVNKNFEDVEDEINDNVLDYLVKHEYQDATEDSHSGTSYVTKKTHTITGGTFAIGFWVFASGWGAMSNNSTSYAQARLTVGGTEKIDFDMAQADVGTSVGVKHQAWCILYYVPSSDGDWTPASDVDIDIDLLENGVGGDSVLVNQLVIWGR